MGVVNRTPARALEVAALAGTVGEVIESTSAGEFELIINATSVGMAGTEQAGRLPLDADLLDSHHTVVDLVYSPVQTALLEVAAARGATPVDGVGMLVGQAALAFQLWTGTAAPVEEMVAAARAALANLVE